MKLCQTGMFSPDPIDPTISSGIIVAIAVPIVLSSRADVLSVGLDLGQWIGLAVLALVGWLLYRTGKKGEQAA